jgi:hypothetical protein
MNELLATLQAENASLKRRLQLALCGSDLFYMDRHGGGYIAIGVPAAASMFTRGHTIYLGMPKEKASTA